MKRINPIWLLVALNIIYLLLRNVFLTEETYAAIESWLEMSVLGLGAFGYIGIVAGRPMSEMIGWIVRRRNERGFIAGFKSGFARLFLDPLRIEPIRPRRSAARTSRTPAACSRCFPVFAGSHAIATLVERASHGRCMIWTRR